MKKRNGKSAYSWPHGRKYVGEFKDGNKQDQGIFTQNNVKHEGNFKNDLPNGKGKVTFLKKGETFEEGEVKEGNFKNGKWHGNFKITFLDGEVIKAKYNMGVFVKKIK